MTPGSLSQGDLHPSYLQKFSPCIHACRSILYPQSLPPYPSVCIHRGVPSGLHFPPF